MKSVLLLLVILLSHPALACGLSQFTVDPPRPTTSDRVELRISGGCPDGCTPYAPHVTIDGTHIAIRLEQAPGCILIPVAWGERVVLGKLPAGTYEVTVATPRDGYGTHTFTVTEPAFEVIPRLGWAGTEVLLVQPHLAACDTNDCPLPAVTFGGVPALSVRRSVIANTLIAVAPNHVPGRVDVTIRKASGETFTAVQAFRYPGPQEDIVAEYERVLFPSVLGGSGAHGSLWQSRNIVRNNGPISVWTYPQFPLGDIVIGTPPAVPLEAGQRAQMAIEDRDGGAMLFVPRGLTPRLSYASHITDLSRRADDAGTEIRVVHEQDTAGRLNILDVPFEPRFRRMLRIYDIDAVEGRDVLISITAAGGTHVAALNVNLSGAIVCGTVPCFPSRPTFAAVNLDAIPALQGVAVADIQVRARTNQARLWAFVTVTNNETQQVTTYSPQQPSLDVDPWPY